MQLNTLILSPPLFFTLLNKKAPFPPGGGSSLPVQQAGSHHPQLSFEYPSSRNTQTAELASRIAPIFFGADGAQFSLGSFYPKKQI